MSPLAREVRLLLSSLNQFISKMPAAKIPKARSSIKDLISVQNPDSEASLKTVLKNLQYKYNFLKIAYPTILPQPQPAPQEEVSSEPIKDVQLKFDFNLYWNNINETGEKSTMDSEKSPENQKNDEQTPPKTEKSGKFIMKDGKLVPGESEKRSLVDFSNWVAAHVDPEDLKKHRELLDRQHFRGPMWEGKKIPPSILDEENPVFNMDVKPEVNPNLIKPKEEVFETVKR